MLAAIIVAGGSSRRMGLDKTFAELSGAPVVVHSVAAFEATAAVGEIVIVARAERLEELRELLGNHRFSKVRAVVAGGVRRQDSVSEGLRRVSGDTEFVGVHDAARPLVTPVQIERVYEAARLHAAAALAAPVTDTLKRANLGQVVTGSVEREGLFAMQTPQIFARDLLAAAYKQVAQEDVTIADEVSAVERLAHKVVLVPSDDFNFKITYPVDLELAELVLKLRASRGR